MLRDHHGAFILSFSHRLHACNSLESEVWGILHGLSHTKIVIDSDSIEVIEFITGGISRDQHLHPLITEILDVGGGAMNVI